MYRGALQSRAGAKILRAAGYSGPVMHHLRAPGEIALRRRADFGACLNAGRQAEEIEGNPAKLDRERPSCSHVTYRPSP